MEELENGRNLLLVSRATSIPESSSPRLRSTIFSGPDSYMTTDAKCIAVVLSLILILKEQYTENNKMKLKDVMQRAKCGVLGALVAVLGALPAFGDKFVTYWDPDLRCELWNYAAPITEDTSELKGGLYYVEGNISLDHSLVVEKSLLASRTEIILMDGASLIVRGQGTDPGLEMDYDDWKLAIYGQRGGTGTLSVYGGEHASGIQNGSVTVYGGRVKSYGGANAPGLCCARVEVQGGSLEAFGKNGNLGIGGRGQYFVGDAWNLVWTDEAGGQAVSLKKGDSGYQNCETPYIRIVGATPVTADTSVIGGGNWFIAEGALARAGLTVNGMAHLVLWDGCDLSLEGSQQSGIEVSPGNELEILGLPTGTGKLTACGSACYAGIGGGDGGAGGTVTINGGMVTATGGRWGAGIGGGNCGAGGNVTINGGTVRATGGDWAASIGGGFFGIFGNIGGSCRGAGGILTINGGSVMADALDSRPRNAAGEILHKVTVRGLEGLVRLDGLEGYGTSALQTIDGCLYLYLPDGDFQFRATAGGQVKSASFFVVGRDVTVILGETGRFFINGVDFSMGEGDGWIISDNRLILSREGMRYELSGAKDGLGVDVREDATVVLSNATIRTSGNPTVSVDDGKTLNLRMSGFTSYLVATNDASAIALGQNAKLNVGTAPGADQLATIVAVAYDESPAVSGSTADTEVFGGTFLVKADAQAVDGFIDISLTPDCPLLMKTGSTSDGVHFAETYLGEAFVGIVPSCTITVPSFTGVASIVVSNDVEELKGDNGVYRAMLTEDLTVDFFAAEGYEIVSGARIFISDIRNDVTVGEGGVLKPDVRRKLTVTLPETLEGETYAVLEDGREVEKVGGGGDGGGGVVVYPVLSGYDIEIVCTAQEDWRIVSETNVVRFAAIDESKTLAAADLPEAWRVFKVMVPEVANAAHTLTTSDALADTGDGVYTIVSNAEVTVTFYGTGNYRVAANGEKTWTLTGDVVFGETEGFLHPTVEGIPGTIAAPWSVGDNVQAYTNGAGVLTIEGTGAMRDFTNAADVPWNPSAVTAVTVGGSVERLGANAFAALDDAVTVNGTAVSIFRFVAPALGPAQPSGAISPAEFERIDIVDGVALLDVSVYTSDTITNENWSVATNVVIEVPAPGKQGFFILKSKAVPSDAPHSPITILE